MELIKVLLEDTTVQQYIESQNDQILKGAQVFSDFPKVIKQYVSENLSQFIEGDNSEMTRENIIVFTEAAVHQFLNDLSSAITEGTLEA